jgi:S-methylmethionine-dependent homocysteine/selenocysteine methylase
MDPVPLLLTEGGLETWLVYHEGVDLPHFAAFDLIRRPGGRAILERHYRSFAELGAREAVGVILETATWRASADWGARLGYDARQLEALHHELVDLLVGVRAAFQPSPAPILLAGCVGPRSDAYAPAVRMTVDEAAAYHGAQLATFAAAPVDLVVASTLGYVEEALGVAGAAGSLSVPLVLSFTVETDGRLPSGQRVGEAIEQVDRATGGRVAYFMINCAHPSHVARGLEPDEPWQRRLCGLRANASAKSHAELDAATALDEGDADDLAASIVALRSSWPTLGVVGGCCGTDGRHVEGIVRAWRLGVDPQEPVATAPGSSR